MTTMDILRAARRARPALRGAEGERRNAALLAMAEALYPRRELVCVSAQDVPAWLAETGELVNIDGVGNRVASTLYGHRRVYFVVGRNKVAPDYDAALWRARNIASPKNAQRIGVQTPCAAKGDKCYDCKSPQRICRGLVVLWEPMMGMEQSTEVLLVDEELGY